MFFKKQAVLTVLGEKFYVVHPAAAIIVSVTSVSVLWKLLEDPVDSGE